MKAIQVTSFGGPDVLTLTDIERPTLKDGEALVRVAAAGVNFMDIGQRAGRRAGQALPFVPGGEASGTVESVGPGVTAVKPGDRVMYAMIPGSYAEFAAVPRVRSSSFHPRSISYKLPRSRCMDSPRTICCTNSGR